MSVEPCKTVRTRKYNFVQPDGGWAYMIALAVTIILMATTAFIPSFGLIFNIFLKEVEMGTMSVTLMNGLASIFMATCGFIVGPLLKVISARKVAFIGSFLFNVGALVTVFVHSEPLFILFQGVVMSSGLGMLYNVSFTILNEYFLEKRLLAVTLTQTVAAAATIIAPMFVKWSLFEYGFRGTLILISGINLHIFIACALLQPVEWHLKKIVVSNEDNIIEEIKLLVEERDIDDGVPRVKITDKESESAMKEKKENDELQIDTILQSEPDSRKGIMRMISKVIDISEIKSFLLSNACLGTTFCVFVEFNFIVLLPQALYVAHWNETSVAWALTLISLGDLVMRILLILLNKWMQKIENQIIYVVGTVIAFVTRLGMLWSDNHNIMLIFLTIMGVARCVICSFPPLVICEAVGQEKFPIAMGTYMMIFGIACLVLGPAIGAIRDLTDSYPTIFYILTSFLAVVIIFWSIELCYKKNKHNRKLQKDMTDKSCTANKRK